MFTFFKQKKTKSHDLKDFEYLSDKTYYFDSACQTLRPQQVIDAEMSYYREFNTCGHRVKYPWGEKLDRLIEECRQNLLKLTGKNSNNYTVAFCLNTTHGINTILHQVNPEKFNLKNIIISEIEHNSVFLNSITWAKKYNLRRLVLPRIKAGPYFGSLEYTQDNPIFPANSLVMLNTMSNIDGQELVNVQKLAKDVHEKDGLLFLDACQTFAHNPAILEKVDFDAVFGSGHKMYAPSIGFIIIKKSLLKNLDCYLIGGSTVQDVKLDSYELIENEDEIYSRIEPGLQNYAGIVGLNAAILWKKEFLKKQNKVEFVDLQSADADLDYEKKLAIYLNKKLLEISEVKLLNSRPSSVVSLYSEKIDSHKMSMYLGEFGIMCRSGYHCCHYYLKNKLNLPPLFRISLGLHNTVDQIDYLIDKLKLILE